jgi:large subunit ribosomal protein L9
MSSRLRNVELLLLRTIENLGLVGDVVKVRAGYARNYLLPLGLAEHPTAEKIEMLKEARALALAEVAKERSERESLIKRMSEIIVAVRRSCNDQGLLYGSISQRDVSEALTEAGYPVDVRSVRLAGSIRRIGEYTVPIQLDKDLRCEITLKILADRELDDQLREREEEEAAAARAEEKANESSEASVDVQTAATAD